MDRLTVRITPDLLRRLDSMANRRGLKDRSEAARTAILEAVMDPEERATVPDREELLRLLGDSARTGNVTAMKTLLEEHRRDGNDESSEQPVSVIDQLASKRAARAS